jgi:hypothetical protein
MTYCTYITIYSGNLLPPFYIGSSSVKKIENGYRGSVSSKKFKNIWKEELKNNPHLFKTVILTRHAHRKEATVREYQFQISLKAPINPLYINEAYAKKEFAYGKKQSKEHVIKRTAHRKGKPGSRTGHTISPEHRERFTFKGRKHTAESKQKNRESHEGKLDSLETKKKKSESATGKPKPWLQGRVQSKETIDKQNASRRKNFETWSDEKKQHKSEALSNSLSGKPKKYITNCAKKFICRLSDRKEMSKASAGKYMSDLKPYF